MNDFSTLVKDSYPLVMLTTGMKHFKIKSSCQKLLAQFLKNGTKLHSPG